MKVYLHVLIVGIALASLTLLASYAFNARRRNQTADHLLKKLHGAARRVVNDNEVISARFDSISEHVFNLSYEFVCKKLKVTLQQLKGMEYPEFQKKFGAKVLKLAEKAYAFSGEIRWVSGTGSPACIGIALVSKKGFLDSPALVPSGRLLSWNIVPLTGELKAGLRPGFVNRTCLSGTPFWTCKVAYYYAHQYHNRINHSHDLEKILNISPENIALGILDLKIRVLRLIHTGASPETLKQAREHIKNNILSKLKPKVLDWQVFASLIGLETKDFLIQAQPVKITDRLPRGTLVCVEFDGKEVFAMVIDYDDGNKGYILVIKHNERKILWPIIEIKNTYDTKELRLLAEAIPLSEEKLTNIRHLIIKEPSECGEDIVKILRLFDTEKPLQISSIEKVFLDRPFPIIWGVTSTKDFVRVQSKVPELGYAGELKIGSDVTVAFTKAKRIGEVKQWLHAQNIHSVKVMSFGTMAFLYTIKNIEH